MASAGQLQCTVVNVDGVDMSGQLAVEVVRLKPVPTAQVQQSTTRRDQFSGVDTGGQKIGVPVVVPQMQVNAMILKMRRTWRVVPPLTRFVPVERANKPVGSPPPPFRTEQ